MKTIKTILLLALLSFSFFLFRDFVYSTVNPEETPLESNPQGIAINPETNIALIAIEKEGNDDSEGGYVSVINLDTQVVISKIPVSREPKGIAIDRTLNIALVGNRKDHSVSVIDLNTFSVIKTIPVGKEPESIAMNQRTHIGVVTNHKDDTVSVIDLQTYKIVATIPVGKEPKDVAIDPGFNLALVVNEKKDEKDKEKGKDAYSVSVIDLKAYQVIGAVAVGKKPQAIDINPETHLAAVANEKDNSITVINLLNWQTTTLPVGKHPIDLTINPLDNRALVVCDEDRILLLIDLDTNATINKYSLNKKPRGVALNNFTNIAAVIDEKTDGL